MRTQKKCPSGHLSTWRAQVDAIQTIKINELTADVVPAALNGNGSALVTSGLSSGQALHDNMEIGVKKSAFARRLLGLDHFT